MLGQLMSRIRARSEQGQTTTEYSVMLGVITLVIVATIILLSDAEDTALSSAAEAIGSLF